MTTANSPRVDLAIQASRIAAALKAAERGEKVGSDPGGKIAAASAKDTVSFGVVMDDKILKITMPWATIRDTDEAGIMEYILKQMSEARDGVQ